jgi:biopolymer transport protein TolR
VASSDNKKGYQRADATGTGTYSHQDFTFVRKKRGKIHHDMGEEEGGELNIIPYLDIIINLIMFLLVAQATLVSLGMIDVTAPSYSIAGPAGGAGEKTEKPLRLTVGIGGDGFYVAASGGVLGNEEGTGELTPDGVERTKPTIPMKADGSFDYPALARKLRAIKNSFPKTTSVYVAADENIPYEVIVKTLDASREDASGQLFPNVAFTQIN